MTNKTSFDQIYYLHPRKKISRKLRGHKSTNSYANYYFWVTPNIFQSFLPKFNFSPNFKPKFSFLTELFNLSDFQEKCYILDPQKI